jgi:alpha-tubulin suppressor-like RCC1 family protein
MSSSSRKLGKRIFSLGLVGAGIIACSSQSNDGSEATGSAAAAIAAVSCQAKDIAARGNSTYAIDINGKVWGWGANPSPRFPLGHKSADDPQPLPSEVRSPVLLGIANATQLAAGNDGACAIVDEPGLGSAVKCWGRKLGSLDAAESDDPHAALVEVEVPGTDTTAPLTGVTAIAYGDGHACALKGGEVWCWGDGRLGQLGDGNGGVSHPDNDGATTHAVKMIGVTGVTHVAAAGKSTCVRQADARVLCAGSNLQGELGQGPPTNARRPNPTPVNVPSTLKFTSVTGGGGVTEIGGGGTFCAASTSDSQIPGTYCWGANRLGQVGDEHGTETAAPFKVSDKIDSIFGPGPANGCEILATGTAACWGNNDKNQLTNGGGAPVLTRTAVGFSASSPLTNVFKIAIGATHMCALTTSGLFCWGQGTNGQIGNGGNADKNPITPYRLSVPALACPTAVPAGQSCGAVSNACGEQVDCSSSCDWRTTCASDTHTCKDVPTQCEHACGVGELCVNHACALDPNYCAGGCNSGTYCSNRECVAYCATIPISDATVGTSVDLSSSYYSLTSPQGYGYNNCGSYVISVRNANAHTGEQIIVGAATTLTESECTSSRIILATYTDGKAAQTVGPLDGKWANGFCQFENGSAQIRRSFPYGSYSELRIAAKLERYAGGGGKSGGGGYYPSPVNVQLWTSCEDHVQNGDETGVDCGGAFCRSCPTRPTPHPRCNQSSCRISSDCDVACGEGQASCARGRCVLN